MAHGLQNTRGVYPARPDLMLDHLSAAIVKLVHNTPSLTFLSTENHNRKAEAAH